MSSDLKKRTLGALFGVLVSRLSGVIRTQIVNATYGLNATMDAFNAAFRIPNSLRDLFADGALSAAFVKVYIDAQSQGTKSERQLISITFGFFLCVTVGLSLLGVLYSTQIMRLISGNQFETNHSLELASFLFKFLAFYLPLTMLNAVSMGVLGVHGRTFRAMNGSIFLNVGMILGALILGPLCSYYGSQSIYGLAIGSLLGVSFQFIYQSTPLYKMGLLALPNFNVFTWFKYTPLWNILKLMLPRAYGQSALTLALLINTYFALSLGSGILSIIATTVIIIQVPIGLFGVATGFASQSVLTQNIKQHDSTQFSKNLIQSLQTTFLLSAGALVGFALFMVPFYHLVFQMGKISFHHTILNSACVSAYGTGIIFAACSKVLVSTFFALNQTKYSIINSTVYLCINASLSYLLAPKLGFLGLGLSFGCASCVDFLLNLYAVRHISKKHEKIIDPFLNAQFFSLKIIFCVLFSFSVGLCGYYLSMNMWSKFELLFGVPLSKPLSVLILCLGGLIFLLFIYLIVQKYAPHVLKKFKLKK